jgi:hypothetical protein
VVFLAILRSYQTLLKSGTVVQSLLAEPAGACDEHVLAGGLVAPVVKKGKSAMSLVFRIELGPILGENA